MNFFYIKKEEKKSKKKNIIKKDQGWNDNHAMREGSK
jgi:endo-alpha-1,4-polygalactosaminidase (GH114 family)